MVIGRKAISIGGIAETQELLDFCGDKNIVSGIEIINIQNINEAYERMLKSDVKYRFVIDMKSLKKLKYFILNRKRRYFDLLFLIFQPINFHNFAQSFIKIEIQIDQFSGFNIENPSVNFHATFSHGFLYRSHLYDVYCLFFHIEFY